eukprot:3935581-Rhodomonas_salina.2
MSGTDGRLVQTSVCKSCTDIGMLLPVGGRVDDEQGAAREGERETRERSSGWKRTGCAQFVPEWSLDVFDFAPAAVPPAPCACTHVFKKRTLAASKHPLRLLCYASPERFASGLGVQAVLCDAGLQGHVARAPQRAPHPPGITDPDSWRAPSNQKHLPGSNSALRESMSADARAVRCAVARLTQSERSVRASPWSCC